MTAPRKTSTDQDAPIIVSAPSEAVTAHDLMVVTQLPEITERLRDISESVKAQIAEALALEVTEENRSKLKTMRAQLNKDFQALEERRKGVKAAVMAPYDAFEAVYKELVSDQYKAADVQLKRGVDALEGALRDVKQTDLEAYFAEYAASKRVDIATYADAQINVTLSASMPKLQEAVRAFVDMVAVDVKCLEEHDNADELLAEYVKQGYSLNKTLEADRARKAAVSEQERRRVEREAQEKAAAEAVKRVEAAIPATSAPLAPPTVSPATPEKDPNELLTPVFRLEPTRRADVRRLAAWMEENGIGYTLIG